MGSDGVPRVRRKSIELDSHLFLNGIASNDTDVVIQPAEYDGTGRRMKKVLTNSGDFDATVVYLYDGWKICEMQDGSDNMVQQFIHGTRCIDELVMVRVKSKGDLYVHQAERERRGSVKGFGDCDGDADVDATDKGTPGSTCTGTVTGSCRILDLDYDSSDATLFDARPAASPAIRAALQQASTSPSPTRACSSTPKSPNTKTATANTTPQRDASCKEIRWVIAVDYSYMNTFSVIPLLSSTQTDFSLPPGRPCHFLILLSLGRPPASNALVISGGQ